MIDQNKIITVADYEFFDVLNPKYSICQYKEIQRGQRFRYKGEWRIKVGPKFSRINDKVLGPLYTSVDLNEFILYFKYEPLHPV